MIWLQGGAFVLNFNPNYNGSGLIEASGGNVIVVSFNYRVGPYGFLASEELQEEGNLNVGLHDQRAAMRWVEQNIGAFGGDPDKVTLFGASVGGGTVLLHGLAYGGQPPETDNPPWRAGIAGSVYMPSIFELGDLEFQFQDLLEATGCTDLACLRSLDSERIQEANQARPFPDQTSTPLFPYTAVIDNELFTGNAHDMLAAGNFSTDRPFIIGTSSSEGTLFVPQANTTEDVNTFLRLQFEGLTDEDLVEAHGLYEDVPQTYPGVTATLSPLFFRAAKMYGDASFFCPAVDFSETLGAAGVTAHAFRNNILDDAEVAAGYLVPHTWEVPAVWGPEFAVIFTALPTATSYLPGGANHGMVDVVQSYWLSFVATGDDPNADRAQGSPMWETFGDAGFLRLQSNNTAMEQFAERDAERCEFWRRLSAKTHI
jgi:carboxylesterase type B